MKETPSSKSKNQVPDWLKTMQLNSWEAELLISALLLYMLFQVPEIIDEYRHQHYETGDSLYVIVGIFVQALKVLRIGYIIHIIARGIWVASVGLSYIFPNSLNIDKLKFKGKFRKELENDIALDKTIKNLEKIASLSYALSFMISGMLISAGLVAFYFAIFSELVFVPAFESGNAIYIIASISLLFIFGLSAIIIFIDFITNGFFRRESSTAKPFYYLALIYRYLTLSFIYNRISLTIISNLKRWQGHLVPIIVIVILGGYMFLKEKSEAWDEERYLKTSFETMSRMNYEDLRKPEDPLFATIQSDVITGDVLRLFINTHGQLSRFYSKEDDIKSFKWRDLDTIEQGLIADKYVKVEIDGKRCQDLQWKDYKHPINYDIGFLNYVDISQLENGIHNLSVAFDTANFNDLQMRIIRQMDKPLVKLAEIDFYKTN